MYSSILASRRALTTIMILMLGSIILTGCGPVVDRIVPGPTKVVYVHNRISNIPPKPSPIKNVRFKKIIFGNHVYYGVTKNSAINLTIGLLNTIEYNKKLLKVIQTYNDNNSSK